MEINDDKMPTQCERLQKFLEVNGKINPLQAWELLGIYRLASRIHELRDEGLEIETRNVKVQNKFGEDCHVAEYALVRENAKMHNSASEVTA